MREKQVRGYIDKAFIFLPPPTGSLPGAARPKQHQGLVDCDLHSLSTGSTAILLLPMLDTIPPARLPSCNLSMA